MALTKDTAMPSDEELTVPHEITLSTNYFKTVAPYMALKCENEEFILRRKELEDPRKTLKEGAAVTACGIDFLRSLKKTCKAEVDSCAECVDTSHANLYMSKCRQEQLVLDNCIEEKLGLKRPKLGYFSKLHVHESAKPKPVEKLRDYKAEAAKVLSEVPRDAPELNSKNYRTYQEWRKDFIRPS